MNEITILLLSGEARDEQLLQDALKGTIARIVTIGDMMTALAEAGTRRPALVLIGSGIPRSHAQWLLERMMADATLRGIPVVLMFYESNRSWVLEMIKLGLRAYIQLPRQIEDFRRRIAQHLPEGVLAVRSKHRSSHGGDSVGERLRQRMAKKQVESAVAKSSEPDLARPIPLLEQHFSEENGLMVRISSREIPMFEKMEEYLLRFGGNNSHVIGIFMGLLVNGKIRLGFRDKTERLSLANPSDKTTTEGAIRLIDAYLHKAASSQQPDHETQRITL